MNAHIICGETVNEIDKLNQNWGPDWCDCTVTSPPYNIGIQYADGVNDKHKEKEYLAWCEIWMARLLEATAEDGHFFLNVGALGACPMRPFELLSLAIIKGFRLQNTFHWIKSISLLDKNEEWCSRGQFSPINSKRYVNNCQEYIFHLTPKGTSPLDKLAVGVPFQDKTNLTRGTRGKNGDVRCRGNVWFIPYDTIRNSATQRPHPATFPIPLVAMCLKIAGRPKMVLDPFVGSGTSGVAALQCGAQDFVGIDLSKTYTKATRERLKSWDTEDTEVTLL
jgi:site-specific DNA-methyltransferase (adenine-specific)